MATSGRFLLRIVALQLSLGAAVAGTTAWGEQISQPKSAASSSFEPNVRRLVSLVDYIAGDYPEAVRDGQVVNADEYSEMQDFARGAATEFGVIKGSLPPDVADSVQKQFMSLETLIAAKADVEAIRPVIRGIKSRILARGLLATSPGSLPTLSSAQKLYGEHCAVCHGANGHGDGAGAKGLEPAPRNFHDGAVMDQSSPFKFYNALRLGIAGTSMASFADRLPDDQLWSLAFLMSALRHDKNILTSSGPLAAEWQQGLAERLRTSGVSLALLSKSSDEELRLWLTKSVGLGSGEAGPILATLRSRATFDGSLPLDAPLPDAKSLAPSDQTANLVDGGEKPGSSSGPTTGSSNISPGGSSDQTSNGSEVEASLRRAATLVKEAQQAFTSGDFKKAETTLFDAYLEGFDPAERALAMRDKSLVTRVEQTFIAAREAARQGDKDKFAQLTQAIDSDLNAGLALVGQRIGQSQPSVWSGMGDFFASMIIILREGFEAFLVVAALLTLVRKTGNTAAKKWVHAGWISAIIAGLATFALFNWVFSISGATRETIEAVSTGIAAVGLFYVSFWLLNQAERSKWDKYIKTSALSVTGGEGRVAAMFFVAFIAVYREAAETVLFYQALVNGASAPMQIFTGLVVGCLLLLAISGAIVRFGIRLPMRQFFLATSTLMIGISVVLAGKTVNELVNAGYISPTPITRLPVIDVLGIYPLWESLGLQIIILSLAAFLAYVSAQSGKRT
jgi:high-affinity iron transporter